MKLLQILEIIQSLKALLIGVHSQKRYRNVLTQYNIVILY